MNIEHLLEKLKYNEGIQKFEGDSKQAISEINDFLIEIRNQEKELQKKKFQAKMIKLAIENEK